MLDIKKEVEAAFRSVEPSEDTLRKRFRTTRYTWERVLRGDDTMSEPLKLFRRRIASKAADLLSAHINTLRKVENE